MLFLIHLSLKFSYTLNIPSILIEGFWGFGVHVCHGSQRLLQVLGGGAAGE